MRKEVIKKIWADPVWSKVISTGIIAIVSSVGFALWHFISGLSFGSILKEIWSFLVTLVCFPMLLILVACVFVLISIYKRLNVLNTSADGEKPKENNDRDSSSWIKDMDSLPLEYYGKDYHFFNERLGKAFPGWSDDIKWFRAKDAVDRLEILLATPLQFRKSTQNRDGSISNGVETPLWWFRDISSSDIAHFKRRSKTKILLNGNIELDISKIAVYKTRARDFDFVYAETVPERPSGAYRHKPEWMKESVDKRGYFWEEYALVKDTAITLEEYDDGAAEINGKIVPVPPSVRSHMRFLTKYNFIITFNSSPYNSTKFEEYSLEYFKDILSGSKSYEEFFHWLLEFDRWEGRK
jgi:hypothetical protein